MIKNNILNSFINKNSILKKAYEEGIYSDTPINRKLGRVGKKYNNKEKSNKNVKLIEKIKDGDGEYLVRNDKGEEIGKMYRDTSTGWWRDANYKSKGAWDVSGDYLGDTKEEAYNTLLHIYNNKNK